MNNITNTLTNDCIVFVNVFSYNFFPRLNPNMIMEYIPQESSKNTIGENITFVIPISESRHDVKYLSAVNSVLNVDWEEE